MSPRPNVSEARKSQILQAAEEVFSKKGFEAARMDDIAEVTGLSKGTLYLYFKNKDALVLAILDRLFQREMQQLQSQAAAGESASQRIERVTELVAQDITGMLRLLPIVYSFLALTFRNRTVQRALKAYLRRYLDMLTPLVQAGIDTGEFRPVEPREVAIAASAIIEGTLLLWVYDREAIDPARHIRSGMRLLLEGVRAHG
jgi:AcrR family transcriptional regulator